MIFEKPYAVMGIVNVTDDSFYDGGRYFEIDAAVAHALRLVDDGADIIDIGGASSRPGAKLLPAGKEVERVVPVIEALVKRGVCVPVSVDTVWSEVAGAAFVAGAAWVNDISAGRIDPQMPAVAARFGCVAVLTHSRGTPETMQDTLRYGDVVAEVVDELTVSVNRFLSAGVERRKIVLDPGFGFAKGVDHNIALLRGIGEIRVWVIRLWPVCPASRSLARLPGGGRKTGCRVHWRPQRLLTGGARGFSGCTT